MTVTAPDSFERFTVGLFPQGVSGAVLLRFEALARYASVRAGDAPFSESETDQIVFVASGSTKLVAHASRGREQVVAFHFAGDLVSVPARAAHSYSLSALEDCELFFFPSEEFLRLARLESGVVEAMLIRSMQALARCREKTIALGRKSAQERLASFLITMAERTGSREKQGWLLNLTMSRRDIADSLGLTIETVSRQFGELRDAGLLKTMGRSNVMLLDLPGLGARAGHLPEAA